MNEIEDIGRAVIGAALRLQDRHLVEEARCVMEL